MFKCRLRLPTYAVSSTIEDGSCRCTPKYHCMLYGFGKLGPITTFANGVCELTSWSCKAAVFTGNLRPLAMACARFKVRRNGTLPFVKTVSTGPPNRVCGLTKTPAPVRTTVLLSVPGLQLSPSLGAKFR